MPTPINPRILTRWIYPRELNRRHVIVERSSGGKPKIYPVSDVGNNVCSDPNTTHVVIKGGVTWCFDNTSKIEVVA